MVCSLALLLLQRYLCCFSFVSNVVVGPSARPKRDSILLCLYFNCVDVGHALLAILSADVGHNVVAVIARNALS